MKVTFKIQSLRRMPNPYKEAADDAPQMYFALCDVTELPNNFPMETNPRGQNLNTAVAKRIMESLKDEAERDFFLLNRGILLSAKSLAYTDGELSIVFEDESVHGNIDGGHTYAIIKELQQDSTPGTQFVKLEILTGVEDIFTKLASARNVSVKVPDASIGELENRFKIIKDVIEKANVAKSISYKQNDDGEIEIADILAILNLFNLSEYPNNQTESYPTQSFSGKAKCIERYINTHKKYGDTTDNPYVKMRTIIVDIFKLYNQLETKMGEYYTQSNVGGKYGSVKGVSGKASESKFLSKFYNEKMDYSSPTGFIYPILGALRALVVEGEDGYYSWGNLDPFSALDELGKGMVEVTVNRSRSLGNNPHSVGKDKGHWQTLFLTAKMFQMEHSVL